MPQKLEYLEIPQLTKIFDNAIRAFATPKREFINKYTGVFTQIGKPVALDIKHKTELLDPEKPNITTGCQEWME